MAYSPAALRSAAGSTHRSASAAASAWRARCAAPLFGLQHRHHAAGQRRCAERRRRHQRAGRRGHRRLPVHL